MDPSARSASPWWATPAFILGMAPGMLALLAIADLTAIGIRNAGLGDEAAMVLAPALVAMFGWLRTRAKTPWERRLLLLADALARLLEGISRGHGLGSVIGAAVRRAVRKLLG